MHANCLRGRQGLQNIVRIILFICSLHEHLGITERTIPYRAVRCFANRKQKLITKKYTALIAFGMHEPWEAYDKCRKRTRNKGSINAL